MVVIGVIGTIGFKKVHRQDFHWTYLFIFWFWKKKIRGFISCWESQCQICWNLAYEHTNERNLWPICYPSYLSCEFEESCVETRQSKNQLRAILKRYFVFARVKQINGIDNDQYWSGRVKFLDLLPQRLCWWFTWLELLVKALLNVNLCNWSTWCYVS